MMITPAYRRPETVGLLRDVASPSPEGGLRTGSTNLAGREGCGHAPDAGRHGRHGWNGRQMLNEVNRELHPRAGVEIHSGLLFIVDLSFRLLVFSQQWMTLSATLTK